MKIELAEVEQWKNREWTQLKSIVRECNQKEYSIMKRIVGAIAIERDKENIDTNNKKDETENQHTNNHTWSSRPNTEESLPQKNNESKGRVA